MSTGQGYRTGFDDDDFSGKGTPYRGKIGPGRSLYTDEFYGNRDLVCEDQIDEEESRVWDLGEMGVEHPEGQDLIGDENNRGIHYGKGPKDYRRSDQRIFEDICEALKSDPRI